MAGRKEAVEEETSYKEKPKRVDVSPDVQRARAAARRAAAGRTSGAGAAFDWVPAADRNAVIRSVQGADEIELDVIIKPTFFKEHETAPFAMLAILAGGVAIASTIVNDRSPLLAWALISAMVASGTTWLWSWLNFEYGGDSDDQNTFFLTVFAALVSVVVGLLFSLIPTWLTRAVRDGLYSCSVTLIVGFLRIPISNRWEARRYKRAYRDHPSESTTAKYFSALDAVDEAVVEPAYLATSVTSLEELATVFPDGWAAAVGRGGDANTEAWLALECRRRVAAIRRTKRSLLIRATTPDKVAKQLGNDLSSWVQGRFHAISADDDVEDLAPVKPRSAKRARKLLLLVGTSVAPLALVGVLYATGAIDEADAATWARISVAWAILGLVGAVDHEAREQLLAAKALVAS